MQLPDVLPGRIWLLDSLNQWDGEMWVEEASTVDISHITRFFTNQQYDRESGLYYYNARYYDPHLGSFITPDPSMSGLNHYNYANSNPIKYTDPSGLASVSMDAGMQKQREAKIAKMEWIKRHTANFDVAGGGGEAACTVLRSKTTSSPSISYLLTMMSLGLSYSSYSFSFSYSSSFSFSPFSSGSDTGAVTESDVTEESQNNEGDYVNFISDDYIPEIEDWEYKILSRTDKNGVEKWWIEANPLDYGRKKIDDKLVLIIPTVQYKPTRASDGFFLLQNALKNPILSHVGGAIGNKRGMGSGSKAVKYLWDAGVRSMIDIGNDGIIDVTRVAPLTNSSRRDFVYLDLNLKFSSNSFVWDSRFYNYDGTAPPQVERWLH